MKSPATHRFDSGRRRILPKGFDESASPGAAYAAGLFELGGIAKRHIGTASRLFDQGVCDALSDQEHGRRIFHLSARRHTQTRIGRQAWHEGYMAQRA